MNRLRGTSGAVGEYARRRVGELELEMGDLLEVRMAEGRHERRGGNTSIVA